MPVSESSDFKEKFECDYGREGLHAETRFLFADRAPATIETVADAEAAEAGVVSSARRAVEEGANAVLVACFSDPGVTRASRAVGVPVLGEGRTTIAAVGALHHRFSILSAASATIAAKEKMVGQLGLSSRLHSIVGMDIPVLELTPARAREVANMVVAQARLGADAVILGCTGSRPGFTAAVRRELDTMDASVALIDPADVAGRVVVAAALSSGAAA